MKRPMTKPEIQALKTNRAYVTCLWGAALAIIFTGLVFGATALTYVLEKWP